MRVHSCIRPKAVGRDLSEREFNIGEALIFTGKIIDIHLEARGATLQPKVHHVMDRSTDIGISPVEIGLLRCKE